MTKTFTKASIRAIIARVKEALEAEKDPASRQQFERALDYWERRLSMQIDEAIKMFKEELTNFDSDECPVWQDTIKLGIEALKRCKVLAQNSPLWATSPLPGEDVEKERRERMCGRKEFANVLRMKDKDIS